MNTILLKTTVALLFITMFFGKTSLANDDTVKVKTFLITLSDRDNLELSDIWEKDFILKFQWEPEGLYVITKYQVTKNQLDDVFQKLKIWYSIDDPVIRELPKKMFPKL